MKFFDVFIRVLLVCAICIVASALYISTAHAVSTRTYFVDVTCPENAIDGVSARASVSSCYGFVGSVLNVFSVVSSGVLVRAQVICADGNEGFEVYRSTSTGNYGGNCWTSAGGYVAAKGVGFSVDSAPRQTLTISLVIANVFCLLASIAFGWRMAIRPPSGLME